VLFSLFISGVVDAWKEAGLGVEIANQKVAGLLYADDIVLVAESIEELHRALAIMDEHARRWRYRFNAAKCSVVAFGSQSPTEEKWKLQGSEIKEDKSYKYLGLQLQHNSVWKKWHDERKVKGWACLPTMWWCGARQGQLSTATGRTLMEMMLWPSTAYGGELASPGKTMAEELEVVQRAAARQLLGVRQRDTNVAMLQGELGWISLEARRHISQLALFHQLQRMPEHRLVRAIFNERMQAALASRCARYPAFVSNDAAQESSLAQRFPSYGFCPAVFETLLRYGLQEHFTVNSCMTKARWRGCVRAAVEVKEIELWQKRVDEARPEGRMAFYRGVKEKWGPEPHLMTTASHHRERYGRALVSQMRTSSAPLNALQAMRHDVPLQKRAAPTCTSCSLGEREDQGHFMCECPLYAAARAALFTEVHEQWDYGEWRGQRWWLSEVEGKNSHWNLKSASERAQWMLRHDNPRMRGAVSQFLVSAFTARRKHAQRASHPIATTATV
jgi:hypothetical protein